MVAHLVPDMAWHGMAGAHTVHTQWAATHCTTHGQSLGARHGMVAHLVPDMAWHGMAGAHTVHTQWAATHCTTHGQSLGARHGMEKHLVLAMGCKYTHTHTHSHSKPQHTTDGPPIYETIIQPIIHVIAPSEGFQNTPGSYPLKRKSAWIG